MLKIRVIGLAVLPALLGIAESATAQEKLPAPSWLPDLSAQEAPSSGLGDHLSVELGLHVAGISAYRSAVVPRKTDYVLSFRGLVDPLGRYRTDFAATLNPSQRLSLSAFATASTLERNRFYGYGNASLAPNATSFYRLDQMLFETGLAASLALGASRNAISFGPFYRSMNTDRELPDSGPDPEDDTETVDGGGVMNLLRPYGAGAFKEIGFRTDLRLATEGPESAHHFGVRFYGGGSFSPAVLSMRTPVLSLYSDAKAFVKLPGPVDPTLYLRGGVHRVFGQAPFHSAAYLGGSRSLRGYATQRFAGDVAVMGSSELYGTFGQLRVSGRSIALGGMLLADMGRVFNNGVSFGGAHMGAGGGLWLRDHRSGRQATIAVAQGVGGPRLYFAFGEPFWR